MYKIYVDYILVYPYIRNWVTEVTREGRKKLTSHYNPVCFKFHTSSNLSTATTLIQATFLPSSYPPTFSLPTTATAS